jgi:hypothetical protein
MNVTPMFKIARVRSKAHMGFVATLPCTVCKRIGVQVHHLTCSREPKARGLRASDSAVLPMCLTHHNALHARGDERAYWMALCIDPIAAADRLWALSVADGRVRDAA